MPAGTTDITTDLEKRTDPAATDRILMVNITTGRPQYIEPEQFSTLDLFARQPESDDSDAFEI